MEPVEMLKSLIQELKEPSYFFLGLIFMLVSILAIATTQFDFKIFSRGNKSERKTFLDALWGFVRGLLFSGPLWFVFLSLFFGLYFYVEHQMAQKKFAAEIERRTDLVNPMLTRMKAQEPGAIDPDEYWKAKLGQELAKVVATSHRSSTFVTENTVFFQPLHESSASDSMKWETKIIAFRFDPKKQMITRSVWHIDSFLDAAPQPLSLEEIRESLKERPYVRHHDCEGPVVGIEFRLLEMKRNAWRLQVFVKRPPLQLGGPNAGESHEFNLPFFYR